MYEGVPSQVGHENAKFGRSRHKKQPTEKKFPMGCVLVRNLQFLTAVDDVGGEIIERFDLWVASSAAEQT